MIRLPQRRIACWPGTDGARFSRTPNIPKAIRPRKRSLKKLPELVCLNNQNKLPVRLMFQDEARFGRMSDPSSCWAPAPLRPIVNLALVREFKYEYAAVSPWDGALNYMTADKMNTENMSSFLKHIGEAHPDDFSIMVLDGASSQKARISRFRTTYHLYCCRCTRQS